MDDVEHRLLAIEKRMRAAEDELAIIRLIASYGPLIDCGSMERGPALFASDGVYDLSYGRTTGPDAFANLLRGPEHHALLAQGVAHVMGLPWVRVNGDDAIATNTTQLFLREPDGYSIFRVAQNVWKLKRQDDGQWLIAERFNRLIGEDNEARDLLVAAIG